jgi:RNA polymerase sigma-70 factor (ECF subfamily)
MTGSEDRLALGLLHEEEDAWGTIRVRVRQAASPFRHALGDDWEDAVQLAQIALLETLREDRFRWEASFGTFAWRVTSNICVDQMRRRRVRRTVSPEPAAPSEAGEPSPSARLERAERRMAIFRVLMAAPAGCRRLWRMILEGLSYEEMSRLERVSPGTLRVRVHRCRQRAREELERLDSDATGGGVAAPEPRPRRVGA